MKMAVDRNIILHTVAVFYLFYNVHGRDADLFGDYCRGRLVECCSGRDDSCAVPILDTLCYCDIFCDLHPNVDCCPDYWDVCSVSTPDPDPKKQKCIHRGSSYSSGESFKDNCNICTCRQLSNGKSDFFCSSKPCLIRSDIIEGVNRGNYGWKASNYSFLWGKTLEEGIQFRLGTFPPALSTINMTEIHTPTWSNLPRFFDSRLKWATWLQPVRDQGDCGASWAFSSTALASDRLAVMSGGLWRVNLSPQMLISCQSRGQNGCKGGHLDRAWWYLRKHGTSSESCYPYHSGLTSNAGNCRVKKRRGLQSKIPKVRCVDGSENILYLSTPPYRTAAREKVIMQEIYNNGPVQATFRVKEDFYSYSAGVYRYTKLSNSLPEEYRKEGWHSIRIIGWGEDLMDDVPIKYWLCANSWGSSWGEDGYFRILRGVNECDIESFIVGVWANLEEFDDKSTLDTFGSY